MAAYHLPRTILLGAGVLEELPHYLQGLPGKRALLVTDRGVIDLGIAARVQEVVEGAGKEVVIYDGVTADPTLRQVAAGVKVFLDNGCELVIAVGGGSPIDCAKGIALVARTGVLEERLGATRVARDNITLVAIPTTAGTGSEATQYLVITDPESGQKMPISDPGSVPAVAVCDALLTRTLPPKITAATGMDAFVHALEAYLCKEAKPFTDALAGKAMESIVKYLPRAVEKGQEDIEARERMMEAQLLAGIAFSNSGLGYVHATAHALGARYHLPHGYANAFMLPYVLAFNLPAVVAKLAQLAPVFGIDTAGLSQQAAAGKVGMMIWELLWRVGIHDSLAEAGAREDDIPALARAAARDPVAVANPRPATEEDLQMVFRAALKGGNPFYNGGPLAGM